MRRTLRPTNLARRLSGRPTRLLAIGSLLAISLTGFVASSVPAGASPTYENVKTTSFAAGEPTSYTKCLQKSVTLPKLGSSEKYAWADVFPQERSAYVINFHQTFSGTFEWTVCVQGMTDDPNTHAYGYKEWSTMTLANAACENNGKCTTYQLSNYYISAGSKNTLWGSEIYPVTSDNGSPLIDGSSSCEETATVKVTTS